MLKSTVSIMLTFSRRMGFPQQVGLGNTGQVLCVRDALLWSALRQHR